MTDVDWHLTYNSLKDIHPYQLCMVGKCKVCGGRLCIEQKTFGIVTTDDFLAAAYRHLYQFHHDLAQPLSTKAFREKFVEMFRKEDRAAIEDWLALPENSHVARMYRRSVKGAYTIVHSWADADQGEFPSPSGAATFTDREKARAELNRLVTEEKENMEIPFSNTKDVETAKAAVEAIKDSKPILNGANKDNFNDMNEIAKAAGLVLGVSGTDLSELHDTVAALEKAGNKNLILDVTAPTIKETFANAVLVRRTAIKDGDRTFGYPSIVNLGVLCNHDEHLETALAAMFVVKYGSIIVMDKVGYAEALPLYGLRQNIFTDPQKPMKVAPGIYPINGAGPDDPCALTVDFALTYFLVSGELERSKIPVNLLITDASGMSVLTAWAAGKFSSTSVKKFFDEFDVASKINNRTLIIPGKVAVMKGEIQDKLPEWNVVVGTREAVELVKYLRDGEHIKAAEAAAASKAPAAEKKEAADANAPLDFEKIAASIPAIEVVDMGVSYKQRDPESPKFVTIGERIHCISPVIREAMNTMNPEPILKRAAEQIKAGATYLDVNIGPAESNGPELMTWAVKLLQENFNNVPLALDTANKRAIEAGIKVYNRTNGKPIVNSADAGSRISYIDLAAANDAICIALCSADGIAKDNEERMMHCHHMLERGLSLGMEATDLWFDPLFLVVKGMQDKQMDVLNAIKLFSDEGLKSTGGLSNNSNGAPKNVRPIMDSALVAMAMMQGLTSAIVNPNDLRLMETIKSCDIFKNNELYSDSYLDL